jgi:hypothetical protein
MSSSPSATPLSDALVESSQSNDQRSYEFFVQAFARTKVGAVIFGAPDGFDGDIKATDTTRFHLGNTTDAHGKSMILTFADPKIFVRNYGGRCNGEILGIDVFKTVIANPQCEGVRVNCATAEISVIISRDVIERFIESNHT